MSVGAVLLLTVTLDLGAPAKVGANFLLCKLAELVAAWRLRSEIVAMRVVFVAFMRSLAQSGGAALGIVAAAAAPSLALGWRDATHRSA